MKLNKIIDKIKFKGSYDNREITHIAHDSRKVKNGTLFIAIAGDNNDGHDFIFDALDKGAVAVVANGRSPKTDLVPIIQVKNPRKIMSKIAANFYRNPSEKLNMIGVTGTNGKTSTTLIVNDILNTCNKRTSSIGTLGFSTPGGIVSTGFTTPESIDLHQILKTMKDGGICYVPMEVSSHAIDMHRVDDVKYKVGIFTNLSPEHLDYHGTMDNYFNSKLKFLKSIGRNNYCILNKDDLYFEKITKEIKSKYISYGFDKNADICISNFEQSIDESKVELLYKNKNYNFKTNLIGKHNVYNIVAAISACATLKINFNQIIESISAVKQIPGRMEKIKLINNNFAIVDYAHTPDAFENILSTVKEISNNKKIITIFGCGGNRDKNKRPLMAEIAENFSDETIITTDNPRNEILTNINNDIVKGFKNKKFRIINDRKISISKAIKNNKDAVIVVLGKGIENYQIINNKKIPYSDIETISEFKDEN